MALADFDDDGRLDLFEANGRVERASDPPPGDPYAEENVLLRGGPDGRFEEVLPRGGTRAPLVATSRGAAFGDVDGDGGLDVLVVNRDGPAHLLHNVVPARGHWLRLEVRERSGRAALGALVTVVEGERRRDYRVRGAYSYASANDTALHVGLGDASRVSELVVRWVDGTLESFGPTDTDRVVTLRRGRGRETTDTGHPRRD